MNNNQPQSQPEVQQGDIHRQMSDEVFGALNVIPPAVIVQVRDLVHEYGNAWDLTIEQENDLLERLIKFYRAIQPQSSLKPQLEAVIGELEKEAESGPRTVVNGGKALGLFIATNRLRELLKNV